MARGMDRAPSFSARTGRAG